MICYRTSYPDAGQTDPFALYSRRGRRRDNLKTLASEKQTGAFPAETAEGPMLVCPTPHQMRECWARGECRAELDVLGLVVSYRSHTLLSSVVTRSNRGTRGSMFTTSVSWNSDEAGSAV